MNQFEITKEMNRIKAKPIWKMIEKECAEDLEYIFLGCIGHPPHVWHEALKAMQERYYNAGTTEEHKAAMGQAGVVMSLITIERIEKFTSNPDAFPAHYHERAYENFQKYMEHMGVTPRINPATGEKMYSLEDAARCANMTEEEALQCASDMGLEMTTGETVSLN